MITFKKSILKCPDCGGQLKPQKGDGTLDKIFGGKGQFVCTQCNQRYQFDKTKADAKFWALFFLPTIIGILFVIGYIFFLRAYAAFSALDFISLIIFAVILSLANNHITNRYVYPYMVKHLKRIS